jgi:hypothetical protein
VPRLVLRGVPRAARLAVLGLGACVDLKPGDVVSPGASDAAVVVASVRDPADAATEAAIDGDADAGPATDASALPPGPPLNLQGGFMTFGGQFGLCVNVTGGALQAGAFLDSSPCASVPGQAFTLRPGGLIGPASTPDLCLELDPTPGLVRLATCTGTAPQQWIISDGEVQSSAFPDLCLDVKAGSSTPGEPVDVFYCQYGDGQDFWPFGFSVQLASTLTDPETFEPECLNVPDGGAVGSLLADTLCNQAVAQLFTLTDAHEVTFGGNCLGPAGGGQTGQLELQVCSGMAAQHWAFQASLPTGTAPSIGLVTIQTFDPGDSDSVCFDILGDDPTPGNLVDAEICNSTDAQRWDPIVRQP